LRRDVIGKTRSFLMLFLYMPFYIFDGMLELYNATASAWRLAQQEPVVIMLEEERSNLVE
jgi:hypothetical protein